MTIDSSTPKERDSSSAHSYYARYTQRVVRSSAKAHGARHVSSKYIFQARRKLFLKASSPKSRKEQTTFVVTNVGPSSAAKLQKRRKPAPTDFYNPPPSIITRDIQVSYNNAIISPGLKAPVEHSSHCFATRGLLRLYSRATLPLSRKLTFYQRLYFLHFKFPLITTERTRSLLNEFAFARV